MFYDDFNDSIIDLTKWNPNNGGHSGRGLFIYDPLTHRVRNGQLELMMKHYHNYNNTNYDYIGAEFITDSTFLFGIFECQATYANQVGSWPAFWSFHQLPCPDNEGPEIDFAEYSCQSSSNKLLSHAIHHWPAVTCGDSLDEIETGFNVSYQFAVSTNIYKSIWTPGKIEYYVDGVLKETHAQNGTEWFPDRPIASL